MVTLEMVLKLRWKIWGIAAGPPCAAGVDTPGIRWQIVRRGLGRLWPAGERKTGGPLRGGTGPITRRRGPVRGAGVGRDGRRLPPAVSAFSGMGRGRLEAVG